MNPLFSDSAAFALQRLTDLGWSPVAAQGMVGNLIQESGRNLNPTALHDGGTGFGIAGFRDPRPGEGRWTNLRNFSKQRGLDHRTLDAQLQFIDHELRTSERGVGNRLRQARDPAEAARVAIDFFRPAGWTSRNPTGGHGWNNRLQNTMTLAGAPMPTNRIAMDQVQQASFTPPMPPQRPGGLGGLGGAEAPAAYASMGGPVPSAQGGGDINQTVPAAMMALSGGDDRQQRAEALAQTIPSLRQAGVNPRQPFTGRASGLDNFGPGGPQPFVSGMGSPALAPGRGITAMQANPMQAPAPNMTPRPDAPPSFMREPQSQAQGVPSFMQGEPPPIQFGSPSMVPDAMPARPSTPNVDAIAGMPSPQQQPPMPAPQPNTGGQNMPRGIDPNQYAGGEWIPPEIGRQLAAQQMSGQASMPAQGAMPAQGGGGAMPAPQGAPGGLGGLGGLRAPLHAMFLSMLSSTDRRTPFANMPQFMQQQAEMEQQMQAQRQAEADRLHDQQLLFGGGGGDAGGGQQAARGEGQEGEAPAATAASFATGNRTVDGLLARRADITNRMMMARTDEARKALEAQRNQIDAEISQRSPTSNMQEYMFDMDQRQQEGLPPIPFRDWDAQRAAARRNEVNVDARNMGNNIGPLRAGERYNPETGAIEEVPGGQAERERLDRERGEVAYGRFVSNQAGPLLRDVRLALEQTESGNIPDNVVARAGGKYMPGTAAHRLERLLSTVKNSVSAINLVELKQTGATVGAVPQSQWEAFGELAGYLDQDMDLQTLRGTLKDIRETMSETLSYLPESSIGSVARREMEKINEAIAAAEQAAGGGVEDDVSDLLKLYGN